MAHIPTYPHPGPYPSPGRGDIPITPDDDRALKIGRVILAACRLGHQIDKVERTPDGVIRMTFKLLREGPDGEDIKRTVAVAPAATS